MEEVIKTPVENKRLSFKSWKKAAGLDRRIDSLILEKKPKWSDTSADWDWLVLRVGAEFKKSLGGVSWDALDVPEMRVVRYKFGDEHCDLVADGKGRPRLIPMGTVEWL